MTPVGLVLHGGIVTNGCFDPVTGNHAVFLQEARNVCRCPACGRSGVSHEEELVTVLLASDDLVRALRGPGRPLLPFSQRASLLAALRSVGDVIRYGSEAELEDIYRRLRPAVLVKGSEWRGKPLTGQGHAGRVEYVDEHAGHASEYLEAYARTVVGPIVNALDGLPAPGFGVRVVPKAWGEEWVFADGLRFGNFGLRPPRPQYTGKLMRVLPGRQSSVHRHAKKHETFLVTRGEVLLSLGYRDWRYPHTMRVWRAGEAVVVEPGAWHRFGNRGPGVAEFVEASTPDDPADTERADPSGPITEAWWEPLR